MAVGAAAGAAGGDPPSPPPPLPSVATVQSFICSIGSNLVVVNCAHTPHLPLLPFALACSAAGRVQKDLPVKSST